jgi:hypothetical protein
LIYIVKIVDISSMHHIPIVYINFLLIIKSININSSI